MTLFGYNRPLQLVFKNALIPIALLIALVCIQTAMIMYLNNGKLVYSLDDPYIHLALAENLFNGHYGVNLSEYSAPSSSVLWPFILAPFANLDMFELVPFIINIIAAAATLIFITWILILTIKPENSRKEYTFTFILACLFIPAINLIGLVFTGMEHSLQVLLAVMTICGLIIESRSGEVRWWLILAIIMGPLIRYENLALSIPAIFFIALRGHFKPALLSGAIIITLLGAFAFFLNFLDLGWFASSIHAKSSVIDSGGKIISVLLNSYKNLNSREGIALGIMFVLLIVSALSTSRPKAEWLLVFFIATSIGMHFMLGRFGWYNRYEIYIWAPALLTAIYTYRQIIRSYIAQEKIFKAVTISFVSVIILVPGYVITLLTNPIASNNIYQQQYQMHRFITQYYQAPVAVNDLGWVAFKNQYYVLDLWGLASQKALKERKRDSNNVEWINKLSLEHNVKFAMIYDDWFPNLPENWRRLGYLQLGRKKITAAEPVVAFYALDPAIEKHTIKLLSDFKQSLPPGVIFEANAN